MICPHQNLDVLSELRDLCGQVNCSTISSRLRKCKWMKEKHSPRYLCINKVYKLSLNQVCELHNENLVENISAKTNSCNILPPDLAGVITH